MKRPLIIMLLVLLVGLLSGVSGQVTYSGSYLSTVPPSPNASSLGVYGVIPVDYYTGIPDIQIPLFSVKNGDIKVDLGLSYHILENKVEQEASWVGLGWSLNAGGVITRARRGLADLTANGGVIAHTIPYCSFNQPDNYLFNFLGYSGQFIINQNNQIIQVKQTDIKIELINNSDAGFIITCPDGMKYEFTKKEYSYNNEVFFSYYGADSICYMYPSSWYLTKITSPTKREVTFQYTTSAYPSYKQYWVETYNEELEGGTGCVLDEEEYIQINSRYDNVYIDKIDFGLGEVVFMTQNREDLKPVLANYIPQKLYMIRLKNKENNEDVKCFRFNTTYFNSGTYSGYPYFSKRLKLLSIDEYGSMAYFHTYSFDYNTSVNLPEKCSPKTDYWGFYNGSGNYYMEPVNERDFESNGTYSKANILTKITYPTGGYTEFEYEENNFATKNDFNHGGGNRIWKIINFDRGKKLNEKIYKYVLNDQTLTSSGKLQLPVFNKYPIITVCLVPVAYYPYYTTLYGGYLSHNKGNCLSLGTYSEGHLVGYSRVVEYSDIEGLAGKTEYYFENTDIPNFTNPIDLIKPHQLPAKNGLLLAQRVFEKQEFSYALINETNSYYLEEDIITTSGEQVDYTIRIVSPPLTACENMNLLEYRISSVWIHPTQKVTKEYDRDNSQLFVETTKKVYYDSDYHKQLTKEEFYSTSNDLLKTIIYKYPIDVYTISGLTQSQIDALNELQEQYRTNNVIEQQEIRDSVTTKIIRYNYKIGTGQVVQMENIQEENLGGSFYTTLQANKYDDQYQVITEYKVNDGITRSLLWGYDNIYPLAEAKNASEEKIYFTSFEEDNLEYDYWSKTGERCYPLNSVYQIPKSFPAGNYILSYFWRQYLYGSWVLVKETKSLTSSGYISTLKNSGYIDELRIHPVEAQMTTYIYSPLVGVTSITDENNITTTYNYDSFGRFNCIRDYNGNILKAYDYHYRDE